jgi:peptide subunit release factor 1 (eRF1)
MNTITINNEIGASVVYTETEVLRFIERAKEVDAVQQVSDLQRKEKVDNRNKVRDFFSEVEWQDGEYTFTKSDVNELLDSIGANRLTTRYNANYTITGTFTIECEDEDDAETIFTDNVSVDFYDGEIDVDQIEVTDIEVAE